jgi:hypothetical protein
MVGAAALTFAVASGAVASSISGSIRDSQGEPLAKVPVCLALMPEAQTCLKVKFSDRKGNYSFNSARPGTDYVISVYSDKSARARKFDAHKSYVWAPGTQRVTLVGKRDDADLPPFIGKFNFSNYQRVIALSEADFPEFAQVDLASQPVFLKVSIAAIDTTDAPPETIFLGQVSDPSTLRLEASLPLATPAIDYEIFGVDFSLSGRIDLVD